MNRRFRNFVRRSRSAGFPDFIPAVLSVRWSDDPSIEPARLECVLSRNAVPDRILPRGMYAVSLDAYPDDGPSEGWPRRLSGDQTSEFREFTALVPQSLETFAALHYGIRYESCDVSVEHVAWTPFLDVFKKVAEE